MAAIGVWWVFHIWIILEVIGWVVALTALVTDYWVGCGGLHSSTSHLNLNRF
jgi:hypothetical protein